jgi:hypothetical protein
MPHMTRRLLNRKRDETEGFRDDEQVEIISLDHPDELIDQRKRQFLIRTLQAATTVGTAALLPLAGLAYLQYQRAELSLPNLGLATALGVGIGTAVGVSSHDPAVGMGVGTAIFIVMICFDQVNRRRQR